MRGSRPSSMNTSSRCTATTPTSTGRNEFMMPDPEPSVFANRVYKAMLSDKVSHYADITLISSDAKRVPALSVHLSVSSPYFENLFTSELTKKNPTEISVDIPSIFLYQLLEFIYIDDCRTIRHVRKCLNGATIIPCTLIRDLIILGSVADSSCMQRLLETCEIALALSMSLYPYLTSFVLQAFRQDKSGWGRNMWDVAMAKIASSVGYALLENYGGCEFKCGVIHFDEAATEEVFFELLRRRSCGHLTYHIVFEALVIWASGGTAIPEACKEVGWWARCMIDVRNANMIDRRLGTAKEIATWFDLTRFEARFLSEVVEPSGLVRSARVTEAYKNLSLRYEKNGTNSAHQARLWFCD